MLYRPLCNIKTLKRIDGLSEIRDESDKDGVRIVIELKTGTNPEVILNNLFALTPLENSYGINNVALVNNVPKVLNLKEILDIFISHRREVVTRRTTFDLNKAKERGHILEGLTVALANIDQIISLIKNSKDPSIAKSKLLAKKWKAGVVGKLIKNSENDENFENLRTELLNEYSKFYLESSLFKGITRITKGSKNRWRFFKIY